MSLRRCFDSCFFINMIPGLIMGIMVVNCNWLGSGFVMVRYGVQLRSRVPQSWVGLTHQWPYAPIMLSLCRERWPNKRLTPMQNTESRPARSAEHQRLTVDLDIADIIQMHEPRRGNQTRTYRLLHLNPKLPSTRDSRNATSPNEAFVVLIIGIFTAKAPPSVPLMQVQ